MKPSKKEQDSKIKARSKKADDKHLKLILSTGMMMMTNLRMSSLYFDLIEWYWKSNIVKNDGEIYSEEEVIDFE